MNTLKAYPFKNDLPLKELLESHPDPKKFREILISSTILDREKLVRLWLTEGIPYAFQNCPAIYEDLRGWLGQKLNINSKQITLLGSARIGFSMAGNYQYGRIFGNESDLDLSIVSKELLEEFKVSFYQFEDDYIKGFIKPRHKREEEYWVANIDFGKKNLPYGFFDAKKLPTFNQYPIAQKVLNAVWALKEKLKITENAPIIKDASIRIYQDWDSLIKRVSFNLNCLRKNIA